ncbi:hypothetical protein ACH5BF_11215 [Arcobacter sp. YIC-464]|uniref:hypothetical protein n=1 Tax=Arcobacter sp. YIC-464 TaxID=3376631 RepID=UPI003C218305
MQVYFYAKSGHAIGLEGAKRCAAIVNELKEFDPILCTSDFRAGAFAKDLLGIRRYVNIDVVRNLHNIMQKRDILLYDTDETNELMKEGMNEFCSLVYNLDELGEIIVDKQLYTKVENPSIEKTIFFGDDDYNELFLQGVKESSKHEITLLMGHYFFLGNEKVFTQHFNEVIDEEEYVETIQNSKYLLTASLQTALESISCGNSPVLFKREDKSYNEDLIKKLNIPVIEAKSIDKTIEEFDDIIKSYPTIENFEIYDISQVKNEITQKIEAYKKLTQG